VGKLVKIFDSIYVNNGQKIVLELKDITPKGYTENYRRKLFCSTEGCNAKLSFVAKSGNRSYLRTWRYSLHSKHCLHFFDKEEEMYDKNGKKIPVVTMNMVLEQPVQYDIYHYLVEEQ